MDMKSFGKILGLSVLLVAFVIPLSAPHNIILSEEYTCPDIVVQAMTTTTEACDGQAVIRLVMVMCSWPPNRRPV